MNLRDWIRRPRPRFRREELCMKLGWGLRERVSRAKSRSSLHRSFPCEIEHERNAHRQPRWYLQRLCYRSRDHSCCVSDKVTASQRPVVIASHSPLLLKSDVAEVTLANGNPQFEPHTVRFDLESNNCDSKDAGWSKYVYGALLSLKEHFAEKDPPLGNFYIHSEHTAYAVLMSAAVGWSELKGFKGYVLGDIPTGSLTTRWVSCWDE